MNEAQKIKKQLERYTATQVEPSARQEPRDISETSGDIWSPNWKPDPNFTLPPRYVESEPDYTLGFKVGSFWPGSRWSDGHLERQALPHPNYEGMAGDLITPEMEFAHRQKDLLWSKASMALEQCIRLHLDIRTFLDYSSRRPNKEELQEMFTEQWAWLKGLWNASGLTEPAMEQVDVWADELAARYEAQRKKSQTA